MSEIRKEALLNEYKGNIYEFLTAHSLARHFKIEGSFYQNLGEDIKSMLEYQEKFIREYYPHLLRDLPVLATKLTEDLIRNLEFKKIDKIEIFGKVALASQDQRYGEADILIFNEGKEYPLSLKLGKSKSFLNTKSAGIKSFFSKYFYRFDSIDQVQGEFNKFFEKSYLDFTHKMHSLADIEFTQGFKSWVDHGGTELPGQLKDEFKQVYREFSHLVAKRLIFEIDKLASFNEDLFMKSLLPLLGFSKDNIIQVSTYYKNEADNYILDYNKIDQINDKLKFDSLICKENVNYCDIHLNDRILQIRLKAMNKFTNSSFKVNCSVKYLS